MSIPVLGLCCLTSDKTISYKTITKKSFLQLNSNEQLNKLKTIYTANVNMFSNAVIYCAKNNIGMYRVTSALFPFYETTPGIEALAKVTKALKVLGQLIDTLKIRVVMHPDQFVVLSSDSTDVINNSINQLVHHANVFDLIGLSQTHYNLLNIHGGKRGNYTTLVSSINDLPTNVKSRLTLENDEHCYDTKTLVKVSSATNVPVLFDFHHSLVHNRCMSYIHRDIKAEYYLAKDTWKDKSLVTTHISNGTDELLDRRHSDYITSYPPVMLDAAYVEVEARAKELAIFRLKELLEKEQE